MPGLARRVGAAALVVLGVALARPARAGDPVALQRARQLASQAQIEYRLGHHEQALGKFEEAYRNEPVAALLFNIAQCYRLLGKLKQAATTYRSFLGSAPENPNVGKAQALLKEVESALAQQASAQSTPPLGLATGGQSVLAPPDLPATDVPPPATLPAAVTHTPGAAVASPDSSAPPRSRRLTWVAAGGAALALSGGAVFGLQAASTASTLRATPHATAELEDLRASGLHQRQHANLLLALGGALAVTTGALFVLRF